MEPEAATRARIAELFQEMAAIHSSNSAYWRQGESQSLAEKAAYALRSERLEHIRAELSGYFRHRTE